MVNSFDFLPNYGVLFIDTSSVSERPGVVPVLRRKAELERLDCLAPKLSEMPGLRTVQEVLKEYRENLEDGKRGLGKIGKISLDMSRDTCSLISLIYRQRKKIFTLLSNATVLFDSEKTPDLEEMINGLKPQTKLFFQQANGRTNENETDIELVTAALAYAHSGGSFVSLWTCDNAIARTFVGMSKRFEMKNTGIVYRDSYVVPCYKAID